MLLGQSVAQRYFLQEMAPPGPSPSSLLHLPPSHLRSQGFQGCVSKGPGCTVLLSQDTVAQNGHLVCLNPHSQGICGPVQLSGKESQDQGEAMLHCELAKWQSGALLASPWPLRVTPEGPTMPELPLPGRVCSAEGQRVGHGP